MLLNFFWYYATMPSSGYNSFCSSIDEGSGTMSFGILCFCLNYALKRIVISNIVALFYC